MQRRKILAAGWYGAGNVGDELLLDMLKRWSTECGATLTVISINPSHTRAVHGLEAFDACDLPGIAAAMAESMLFVLGGGGIFQDYNRFSRSGLYEFQMGDVAMFARPVLMARQMGVPTLLWAQGVGPLDSAEGREIVREIYNAASYVSVRDEGSLALLREIGVSRDIPVAPDPVWAFPIDAGEFIRNESGRRIAVIVRPWQFLEGWEERFVAMVHSAIPKGSTLVWVPFQLGAFPGRSDSDMGHTLMMQERVGPGYTHIVVEADTLTTMCTALSECDAVIAMRLHAQILALMMGKPTLSLEYDPKMAAVSSRIALPADLRLSLTDARGDWEAACRALLACERLDETALAHVAKLKEEALMHKEFLSKALDQAVRTQTEAGHFTLSRFDWIGSWLESEAQRLWVERDAKIELLQQEITGRDNLIACRDGEIAGLQQLVAQRDGEIAGLQQLVALRDGEISGLRQLVVERDGEIASLQKYLMEIKQSTSWTVTRPLRFAKKMYQAPRKTGYELARFCFWSLPPVWRQLLHGPRHQFVRWARSLPTAEHRRQGNARSGRDMSWEDFQQMVLARRDQFKGVFVQELVIDWHVPLFQRPQHIAAALGQLGYLVIYRTDNWSGDDVDGFRQVVPNVWVTNRYEVIKITDTVRSFYSTAYAHTPELLEEGGQRGKLIYEYIDHIDQEISGDEENIRRLIALKKYAFGGGADYIVTSAKKLYDEAVAAVGKEKVLLVPNGVDTRHYRNPAHESASVAEPLRQFRARYDCVVGYFGALAPWLWYEVIEEITAECTDIGFVFIGPDYYGGAERLPRRDNVLYLGMVPYPVLPGHARLFDVCCIPFKPGEIARTTSPLKLFEYFALEKPVVVTSEMLECTAFPEVFHGGDGPELVRAIADAVAVKDDPTFKQRLARLADENDWLERARQLEAIFPKRSFFSDVARDFGVTEDFTRLYFERQNFSGVSLRNWQEFVDSLDLSARMYVEFAFSTTSRGREVVKLLDGATLISNKKRYLDVGTGYGGFLRAFAEYGFQEVVGVELQEHLVALSLANTADLAGAKVLALDFVTEDASGLGRFDMITCNDVIEHVHEPDRVMEKMVALLAPDGCLCMEIPNKDCLLFVQSDGHFRLFGLTILSMAMAARYYAAVLGAPESGYLWGMGESYELSWYQQQLEGHGVQVRTFAIHCCGELADTPRLRQEFDTAFAKWRQEVAPQLEPELGATIESAVRQYLVALDTDYRAAVRDSVAAARFVEKYLMTFWTVAAVKKMGESYS